MSKLVMRSLKQLFRNFRIPEIGFKGSNTSRFTDIPLCYGFMFHGYKIEDWVDFNKYAARVMVDSRSIEQISDCSHMVITEAIPHIHARNPPARTEGQLLIGFDANILTPLNIICGTTAKWESFPPAANSSVDQECRRESDFVLIDRASSNEGSYRKVLKGRSGRTTDDDLKFEVIVPGELKGPNLCLGSDLTKQDVQGILRHTEFPDYNSAVPYFQILSYMMSSQKGVGFLTNYEDSRFFKMDVKEKKIYMSPVVRYNQVLNESGDVPHTLQTFLYAETLPDEMEDEENRKILKLQLEEAREEAEEHERQNEKKKAEKAVKEEAKEGDASSWSDKEERSWWIISPVTLVLDKCKVIGVLGEGICGVVKECDYEGVKVALKVGLPFDSRLDDQDYFALVKNEIEIYEMLEELQGKIIPRIIVGGLERYYNPSAMVIVTEKVGMSVEEREDRIFVGEKELSREDLIVMKEKGLEGLKKIHESGVVHRDAEVRNTRVEMRDGKVEKVWWIDFNIARMSDYETEKAIEKTLNKFGIDYMQRMDSDISRYSDSIDRILEKMESQE